MSPEAQMLQNRSRTMSKLWVTYRLRVPMIFSRSLLAGWLLGWLAGLLTCWLACLAVLTSCLCARKSTAITTDITTISIHSLLSTSTFAAIYSTLELHIMSNLVFYYERRLSKSTCIFYAQDAETFFLLWVTPCFIMSDLRLKQLTLKTIFISYFWVEIQFQGPQYQWFFKPCEVKIFFLIA